MKALHQLPVETSRADEAGYELFRELFWTNSEVCCACFSQVRTIGPALEKRLGTSDNRLLEHGIPLTMVINEWYDRTELGSQEHTDGDYNKRFGTCFCLECGTDCNGNHRNKSFDQLKPLAKNINAYTRDETPHGLDRQRFARELCELKREPSAQGHETEVLGLAFARAVTFGNAPDHQTSQTQNHEATAD